MTSARAPRILIFTDKAGVSANMQRHLMKLIECTGVSFASTFVVSLYNDIEDCLVPTKRGQRTVWTVKPDKITEVQNVISSYINNVQPTHIITWDPATIRIVSGEPFSENQARGSVFVHDNIPVFVVDRLRNLFAVTYGYWLAFQDFSKIGRWIHGQQREEPAFSYSVCATPEEVQTAFTWLADSPMVSIDIESVDDWITCIGYTGCSGGVVKTFVVPFWNPVHEHGCYWKTPELEVAVWQAVAAFHASPVIKVLQNGVYDSAYFIKYRVPLTNYYLDTQYMWWATYCELPARLDFIASVCTDYTRFWKEETKGDKQTTVKYTPEMLAVFWRYNALDCYYTFMAARTCITQLLAHPWALQNYISKFVLAIGPALHMSIRGCRVNTPFLSHKQTETKLALEKTLARVRVMVDDVEFNPGSPMQSASLFYDVLGAQPVKIKGKLRSSDEDHLKAIGYQHPMFKVYADAILDFREHAKMWGTYGPNRKEGRTWKGLRLRRNRIHFNMRAIATETERWASGKFMWEGCNGQNIPETWRGIVRADDGYLLASTDFSGSDSWFVAADAQEDVMMSALQEGRDMHCFHAAHFFQEVYEDVVRKAKIEKIDLYANKATGRRAIAKRIGHGCNYWMGSRTLYYLMGRDAVIAAATAVGVEEAHLKTDRELMILCQHFIDSYYYLYPQLKPWVEGLVMMLMQYKRLTNPYGFTRIFFGRPSDDQTKRKASAFIGQSGTGGNINRVVRTIYYGDHERNLPSLETAYGLQLLMQIHDEIVFQFPQQNIHVVEKVLDIMETPVIIKGKPVTVPADCMIGSVLGGTMQPFKRNGM